jgi:hypothetical protein
MVCNYIHARNLPGAWGEVLARNAGRAVRGKRGTAEPDRARDREPSFQTLLRITSAPQPADLTERTADLGDPPPPGIRDFTPMRGIIPPRLHESEFTRPKYYDGMFCDRLLEGQATVQIDDIVLDIKPGDSCTVRSGQVHWLRNDQHTPAVMLTVPAPAPERR